MKTGSNALDEKLDAVLEYVSNIDKTVEEIRLVQGEHTKTLAEHGEMLNDHTHRLGTIESVQQDHTHRLGRIETRQIAEQNMLDSHDRRISRVEKHRA